LKEGRQMMLRQQIISESVVRYNPLQRHGWDRRVSPTRISGVTATTNLPIRADVDSGVTTSIRFSVAIWSVRDCAGDSDLSHDQWWGVCALTLSKHWYPYIDLTPFGASDAFPCSNDRSGWTGSLMAPLRGRGRVGRRGHCCRLLSRLCHLHHLLSSRLLDCPFVHCRPHRKKAHPHQHLRWRLLCLPQHLRLSTTRPLELHNQ
jgi:hypothetical protein